MELLGLAISAATLLVVAAAAVAAIVQLRHLRTSNQLAAVLEIMNQWNAPPLQAALAELRHVSEKMRDPTYIAEVTVPGSGVRAKHTEFLALDFWEQIGTFVKYGLIDQSILMDVISAQVTNGWRYAAPLIDAVRESAGMSAFENFEYLAVRATQWERRFPNGTYPPGFARMRELTP